MEMSTKMHGLQAADVVDVEADHFADAGVGVVGDEGKGLPADR
jgi:hypothetical protein